MYVWKSKASGQWLKVDTVDGVCSLVKNVNEATLVPASPSTDEMTKWYWRELPVDPEAFEAFEVEEVRRVVVLKNCVDPTLLERLLSVIVDTNAQSTSKLLLHDVGVWRGSAVTMKELGLSEVGTVELLLYLEDEFNVSLPDDSVVPSTTLHELHELLLNGIKVGGSE